MKKHLYLPIWRPLSAFIIKCIKENLDMDIPIDPLLFDELGDRKKYSFRIEMVNGEVVNNIGGSAVARDLVRVLQDSLGFQKVLSEKNILITFNTGFVLKLKIYK